MKRKIVIKIIRNIILCVSFFTFSACVSKLSILNLNTSQIMRRFIKGKTTSRQIRAKYGNPTEENIITLLEAKKMFHAKQANSDKRPLLLFRTMPQSTDGTKAKLTQEEISDSKIEVVYWVYINTKTDGGNIFNWYKKSKKGTRLMLIFNSRSVLLNYKFQKYNNQTKWF